MDADDRGRGLRNISEVLVLPGGAISLAMLGIGQDARGELYALGNINGVPFGTEAGCSGSSPLPRRTTAMTTIASS